MNEWVAMVILSVVFGLIWWFVFRQPAWDRRHHKEGEK